MKQTTIRSFKHQQTHRHSKCEILQTRKQRGWIDAKIATKVHEFSQVIVTTDVFYTFTIYLNTSTHSFHLYIQ